jgi:stage V sporulation protein D (sporulation-specific penicillin-binding protein)
MPGRTDSRGRLLLLLLAFAVVATALVARLGWWQVAQRSALAEQAQRQTTLRLEIPSRRGTIYDRSGTVVLASTLRRDRLIGWGDQLDGTAREGVLDQLAMILGLDAAGRAEMAQRLYAARGYVVLARGIDGATSDRIRDAVAGGRLTGIALEPEAQRMNPQPGGGPATSLAAHLLGFVNREGLGQYGVEQRYQDVLAGAPQIVVAQRDARSRAIPETSRVIASGVPGSDVRLTIDAGLQLAVEQELLAAWVADHPTSVSAVVLDPYTGEVYAHASYPSYDGNDYTSVIADDPGRFIDPIISTVYEPGSVMKVLTALAGLKAGTVTMTTKIQDSGVLRLDGGRNQIHDADRRAKGFMELRDGIAQSRNVVAAKVALGLGPSTRQASAALHDVWRAFGLGQPTGIDVAGEVKGIVRDPAVQPWAEIDLANGSFGQGVAVTPIQLASAFAALVNGGQLVQPRVVRAIGNEVLRPIVRGQVMDPGASPAMIDLMSHVVSSVPFYRDRTLVPGYYVGGKTGTAQIWDPTANGGKGEWKPDHFTMTFVGFIGRAPDRPDVIVAVRIQDARPAVIRVGQLEMPVMSFELFRRVATDAITRPTLVAELPAPSTPPDHGAAGSGAGGSGRAGGAGTEDAAPAEGLGL